MERLSSFDDFLAKRFPESRRKAYYLMAIHENLTQIPKQQLRGGGLEQSGGTGQRWHEGTEKALTVQPWLHKASLRCLRRASKSRSNGT